MENNMNIVLCGVMGCGKSTVGKLLSEKLGRELLDTDSEIVKADGRAIPEIFEKKGEPFFRALETDACKNTGKALAKIIATGGGAVIREENVDMLKANGRLIFIDRKYRFCHINGNIQGVRRNANFRVILLIILHASLNNS